MAVSDTVLTGTAGLFDGLLTFSVAGVSLMTLLGALVVFLICFAAMRLLTLLAENALLWLLVIRLSAPAFPAKLLVSVITVVGNYVLCKFGIFRKETVSHG